jgi:hypothetical protein
LLYDSHVVGSINYTIFDRAYKTHLAEQEAHRNIYYSTWYMFISKPEKCLTIIYDKMDHAKMASPCFASKFKNTDAFIRLPVAVMGMIAHGSGDVKFAHFSLDLYPGDSNHTAGSLQNCFVTWRSHLCPCREYYLRTQEVPLYLKLY